MNIILHSKLYSKHILFLCFFLFLSALADEPVGLHVKVLIDNIAKDTTVPMVFSGSGKLILAYAQEPTKRYVLKKRVSISLKDGFLCSNNKKCQFQPMRIVSEDGRIAYNGKTYAGSFYFYPTTTGLDVVNKIALEDYVSSVVRTEAWPSWPIEAFKVQAVASRTYVIYQLQQAQRQKRHFHVVATNAHQTYCGVHTCQEIKDAVQETEGIFLAYKGQPILAMYDACCGGIVQSPQTQATLVQTPYLARSYPCTFCSGFKIYSWTKRLALKKIITGLQEIFPKLKSITTITQEYDTAGLVQRVIIQDKNQTYTINGKKFHAIFPQVPSLSFSLKKHGNNLIVKGRGYGHHMGLCQWGAYELVRQGWDYKRILRFYYPGTVFMKLHHRLTVSVPTNV